jgi:hypothetical protein
MNNEQKAKQLTQTGTGYATAIMCPTLKTPFLIVAATPDDLEALLVIRCQLEPETFSVKKFKRVQMGFAAGETAEIKEDSASVENDEMTSPHNESK